MLILLTGSVITIINLALMLGEFRYRRITVPERVVQDEMARH
jgi:hypothetical protein